MSGSATPEAHALVTGASRGLGLDLARQLATDGWPLVLTARTESDLDAAAAELRDRVPVRIVVSDLSRASERDRLERALSEQGVRIGTLVNNAGFGSFGPFVEQRREGQLDMIRVNVEALTDLTHRFLPGMIEAGRGRILNVASTAGFQPGPLMAVYYATKAYALSFSEALAEEVRKHGVTVSCLCPGPTRTSFQEAAEMEGSRLLTFGLMESEEVAKQAYDGLRRRKRVVVPGFKNRVGTFFVRLLPRTVVTKVVKRINGPVS